nr:tRNA lysidine(34) synthetase TilS [Shimia sp. R9_3]
MLKALDTAFGHEFPDKIGVAVSGGGDSMALLDLLRAWGKSEVFVASVDHGLRPEARDEIALVAEYAACHELYHSVLNWQWDLQGNLQQAAREGRRTALRKWAEECGLTCVALGHTADDQAETFLMRLARGSGVDGLSAMELTRHDGELTWLRPLLNVRRQALRDHLRQANVPWADDPSNEDPTFDRVKARQMMETLEPLGLTVERLAQTTDHMREQRALAAWVAERATKDLVSRDAGDVIFDLPGLLNLPDALKSRLLADALAAVSGNPYRPRFKALSGVWDIEVPKPLHGCLVIPKAAQLRITREWQAVKGIRTATDSLWDGRWRLTTVEDGDVTGLEIAALGEAGLADVPDWRAIGRPRQSLLSSPAIWQGSKLIAAPIAGLSNGWDAQVLAL